MGGKVITYRWLSPDEAETLRTVFEENGGDMPRPDLSAIYGAFTDEGQLVGFHVLQLVPHAEPMWIHPEWRAKVNWRKFQEGIETLFDKQSGGEYYIFPGDERIAKLCKRGGMEEVPLKAYKKVIGN